MKSIWNGSISFGLVTIPIRLYPTAQEHVLGFKMLCGTCKTPIHMIRWCEHCKKEVTWDNVVKGIELTKGHYVALTQQLLKDIKPKKTEAVVIHEFVDSRLVDQVYRNNHYYAAPAGATRAYTLLTHALGSSGKAAIGTFVMRDKEHICMIESYYVGLLLTTLFYDYELRSIKQIPEFKEKLPTITSSELKLANQLIAQLSKKKFDLSHYKDTFAQQLKKLIKTKKAGKRITIAAQKPKKLKTQESLITVLQESLGQPARHRK